MSVSPDRATAPGPAHLAPTQFIDSEHPDVVAFAHTAAGGAAGPERVARLFAAVRDTVRYDPYTLVRDPAAYSASAVLAGGRSYCIPKAVLLAAGARALGIPARLGFADVRNHLQSGRLRAVMGTDEFIYHGYTELHLGGAWRKATPAFNAELCARFGVAPLAFDGTADALLHPFSGDGSRHMEYIRERGVFTDLPLAEILDAFDAAYPGMAQRHGDAEDPAFASS